jgi:hypothetical protein
LLSNGEKGRTDAKSAAPSEKKSKTSSPEEGPSLISTDASAGETKTDITPPATEPESTTQPEESKIETTPFPPSKPTGRPSKNNEVYRLNPAGFVTTIFSKPVVIFSLAWGGENQLLLATGNQGQLLRLDTQTREAVPLHDASPAQQLTALYAEPGGSCYAGTANPAILTTIHPRFAAQGEYLSEVIDAKQVSQWGNIQIEADIPANASLQIATRTGNTADPDEAPWQEWTAAVPVAEDVPVSSEPGRFLQYKLLFGSNGTQTATMTNLKLAHLIPNLPPRLTEVEVTRTGGKRKSSRSSSSGSGNPPPVSKTFEIEYKAEDLNEDTLQYDIYLRPLNLENWIQIAEELTETKHSWDSQTVADGRYEFKVQVTDALTNTPGSEYTDSRISLPIIVDNTPPELTEFNYHIEKNTINLTASVADRLSVIHSVRYALDSSDEWKIILPSDGLFDSRHESFKVELSIEKPGSHLLTVRFEDALGNRLYRNYILTLNP